MSMSFRARFLSFGGRIPRSVFNLSLLLWAVALLVLGVFVERMSGAQASLWLYLPATWCLLALLVKRLHDHGRSAWSLLWLLLPLFGPLYLAVLLGCLRGSPGENQYGDDMLAHDADYLTVQLS